VKSPDLPVRLRRLSRGAGPCLTHVSVSMLIQGLLSKWEAQEFPLKPYRLAPIPHGFRMDNSEFFLMAIQLGNWKLGNWKPDGRYRLNCTLSVQSLARFQRAILLQTKIASALSEVRGAQLTDPYSAWIRSPHDSRRALILEGL
jgi:hypothetical protein